MIQTLASPRLGQIFEHLPGCYLILSADFNIMAASDAYLKVTNCARRDIIGKRILDVFTSHSETDEQGICLLKHSLEYSLGHKKPHVVVTMRQFVHHQSLDGLKHDAFMSVINYPVVDSKQNVFCIIHQITGMTLSGHAQPGDFLRSKEVREIEDHVSSLVVDLLKARAADLVGAESVGLEATYAGVPYSVGALKPIAQSPSAQDPGAPGDLIMIADSNLDRAREARDAVKEWGYRACLARDGAAVLRLWRQKTCAMILIDYQLPILDAQKSATAIRLIEKSHFGHTPIIAICDGADASLDHCRDAGLDGLLSRPLNKKELQNILNNWLPATV